MKMLVSIYLLIFLINIIFGNAIFAEPDLIIDALEHEDPSILKTLIFKGIDVNIPNSDGILPIIMAAVKGNIEHMKIVVEAGADVNAVEADGWTPLMFVVSQGDFVATQYLLYNGASPFYRNNNDMSAYDIAVVRQLHDISYFLANIENLVSIDTGSTESMVLAIDHGADIELQNANGFTALLHMCSVGEHDVVYHLIEDRGANYKQKENDGWSCLCFAAYRGDVATVKYLIALPAITIDDIRIAKRKAEHSHQFQVVQLLEFELSIKGPSLLGEGIQVMQPTSRRFSQ